MNVIHVVAAAIRNHQGDVFIARRPDHVHQGGKLEFPGGKVEATESALDALARELQEELGITVKSACPLIKINHQYPDKSICLDVWEVTEFEGEPHGAEGQETQWVPITQLCNERAYGRVAPTDQ